MNNTATRTTLAIVVLIFTAAALIVGGTLAATIIPSADAYKKGGGGKGIGNTITEHKMKDLAWQQQQTQAQTESQSISTTCTNDQPCHTTAWNTTKSLSQSYPSVDDGDIADLIDDITG